VGVEGEALLGGRAEGEVKGGEEEPGEPERAVGRACTEDMVDSISTVSSSDVDGIGVGAYGVAPPVLGTLLRPKDRDVFFSHNSLLL